MRLSPSADNPPPRSRTLALIFVCLVAAGVALWRHAAVRFPSWERWGAPVACDGYAGVYGGVKTEGIVCLGRAPLLWGEAIAKMGGAGCAVRAIDAGKALAAGDKLTVSSSGGECSIVAGRFSGAEMLALSMPIDINSADARDLEALPSIGPALAARIVEHRTTNGPFQSINDLFFVKGVGPETLKKIAQKVTVGR